MNKILLFKSLHHDSIWCSDVPSAMTFSWNEAQQSKTHPRQNRQVLATQIITIQLFFFVKHPLFSFLYWKMFK